MNNKSVYFAILLLLYSCSPKPDETEEEYQFFATPLTYPLNTKEGYKINPVSGDSIRPIVNSLGDTIKTDKPYAVKGKVIDPHSVQKPKVIRAGKPKVTPAYSNIIYEDLNALPVVDLNESKLKTTRLGKGDSTFVLINSFGDTIPTGLPIPVTGKKLSSIQPRLEPALPLRMKENTTFNIQYLDQDQGMNGSHIFCMLEDRRGNIWFGTIGDGLSCYNGSSFKNYTEKVGFVNNDVLSILEDKSGKLWFGTRGGGVVCYDGISFTNFTEKEGLPNNVVLCILEDKSGKLWFGTPKGATCYDGTSFTHYTTKEGLPNNEVQVIIEDKSGKLWFGTWGGGASRFDGTSFTNYTEKDGLSRNYIYCIHEDTKGDFWFAFGPSGGGASRFNGHTFTKYDNHSNPITVITEDKEGKIWFASGRGGVGNFDGTRFTVFQEKEGLNGTMINSILEDNQGNFWFGASNWEGTGDHGVYFFDEAIFLQYYILPELWPSIGVFCLFKDKNGNLWIGAENDGLYRYDGTTFTNYDDLSNFCECSVSSILEDKSGNLWFGTYGGGVSRFDGTSFTNYSEKEGLSGKNVSCMLEDKNGNLWFGTWEGGISRFDGTRFTHFTEKEGLPSNKVSSILEDKNGNLWFGTWDGGVSRFDGTRITNYTEKEGLSNNKVLCMLEDKVGDLWFGTSGGGMSHFDGANFTNYTEKEGLSNNKVYSILQDESGNIWVNTDKDINYFVIDKVNIYPKIFSLGRQDGFKDLSQIINSAFIDEKNRAWWGTLMGLTMIDINKLKIPTEPPLIYLSELDINEEFINYYQFEDDDTIDYSFSGVSPFENYPLKLVLPYNKNHLTFHYYGIDWAAPHCLKYSYILEGLNNEWSFPTGNIKVDYRNLSYGHYTFKVKAIGMAQVWSKPVEYTFIIRPPLWRTKVAYGFYFLFILGVGYLINRSLRNRLLQKERERNREKELKQKASELEIQALRAQMNPHFIFNSLNSINNFILKNDKRQASEYLIKFSKLIRLILENSTLTLISLEQELEALGLYIELESLRFQHRFDYQVLLSKDLDTISIKVPPLILQPFVENAIHHGLMPKKGPGHLKITIHEMENQLVLKIEDDGIGRYQSGLIHAETDYKRKSLGLKVTSERIGLLNNQLRDNSKIEVRDLMDELGKALGTEINILIPVII